MASSFQVKNNGKISVIVTPPQIPLFVTVLPGQTSPPFFSGGQYTIRSELENLPLPPPEVVVTFVPGELFEAKAINKPSVDIDLIAKFDFSKA